MQRDASKLPPTSLSVGGRGFKLLPGLLLASLPPCPLATPPLNQRAPSGAPRDDAHGLARLGANAPMHRAANPLFILLLFFVVGIVREGDMEIWGRLQIQTFFLNRTESSRPTCSRDILTGVKEPARDEVQRRTEVAEQDCKVSLPCPIIVQGRTRMLLRVLSFARMVRKGEEFSEGPCQGACFFSRTAAAAAAAAAAAQRLLGSNGSSNEWFALCARNISFESR